MSGINVPYVSAEEIQNQVEKFRQLYLGKDHPIPVNVELLAEDIGLEIWPVDRLIELANIDALVAHKLKVIMVDKDEYDDPIRWGRLRFTIAHEIGHFVLHSHLFDTVSFKSIPEWADFVRSIENYDRIEIQAHEFGGRLIVPRDRLIAAIEKEKPHLSALPKEELKQRLAVRLSRVFHVSPDLISARFTYEQLNSLIESSSK